MKKYAVPISIIIVSLALLFSINLVKKERTDANQSDEVAMSEKEKLALMQIRNRFFSELLSNLDFEPLFSGDLFVSDFFDHPERWGSYLLNTYMKRGVEKAILKRYVTARWNLNLYLQIHIVSQPNWRAKNVKNEYPQFVEDCMVQEPMLRPLIEGKTRVTEQSESLQLITTLEKFNPQLRNEILRNELMTTPSFLSWAEESDREFLELTRKEILKQPIFGLPTGTRIYLTGYLYIVLEIIETKDGFKIVAISHNTR